MTQSWADAAAGFDFEAMLRQSLAGDLAAMNACVECCDAHAAADPDRIALRYESRDGHGGIGVGEADEPSAQQGGGAVIDAPKALAHEDQCHKKSCRRMRRARAGTCQESGRVGEGAAEWPSDWMCGRMAE